MNESTKSPTNPQLKKNRKYSVPQLKSFGSVAQLTAAGSMLGNESMLDMTTGICVADPGMEMNMLCN